RVGPSGRRAHLIDINAVVVGGRLQLAWTYSANIHRRDTIQRVAGVYMEALQSLVAEIQPRADRVRTTSEGLPVPRPAGDAPIMRAPRDGHLPLSFAQQRLWFLDQLTPGSSG